MSERSVKRREPRQNLWRRIARWESRQERFEVFRCARRLPTRLVGRGTPKHRGLGERSVGSEHDEASVRFESLFRLRRAHGVVGPLEESALLVGDPRPVVVVEVLRFDRSATAAPTRHLEHGSRPGIVHAGRLVGGAPDADDLARRARG